MSIKLPNAMLAQIAAALQRPPPPRPGRFLDQVWQQVLLRRWAYRYELEDLAEAMDDRLYGLNLETLAVAAGYPLRWVRARPRFANADWTADNMMGTTDVVGFFIFLEELGFRVDPAPLVQSVAEGVRQLAVMTLAEADAYTFERLRQRKRIVLHSDQIPFEMPEEGEWRGNTGYRYRSVMRGDAIVQLTILGPKFRVAKRTWTDCSLCGFGYTRGDPQAAVDHRKAHARVARLLSPRPLKPMRDRIAALGDAAAERVDANAPTWHHREVYERALRFKRDFGYDFVQWPESLERAERNPSWIGFLFVACDGSIDGACAFHQGEQEWALQWVWVRPEKRRCGLLATRWPRFLADFGDFWIEHPLSEAMVSFVARYASPAQRQRISTVFPHGSPIEHPVRGDN